MFLLCKDQHTKHTRSLQLVDTTETTAMLVAWKYIVDIHWSNYWESYSYPHAILSYVFIFKLADQPIRIDNRAVIKYTLLLILLATFQLH